MCFTSYCTLSQVGRILYIRAPSRRLGLTHPWASLKREGRPRHTHMHNTYIHAVRRVRSAGAQCLHPSPASRRLASASLAVTEPLSLRRPLRPLPGLPSSRSSPPALAFTDPTLPPVRVRVGLDRATVAQIAGCGGRAAAMDSALCPGHGHSETAVHPLRAASRTAAARAVRTPLPPPALHTPSPG